MLVVCCIEVKLGAVLRHAQSSTVCVEVLKGEGVTM
jgi:hypothetical protein